MLAQELRGLLRGEGDALGVGIRQRGLDLGIDAAGAAKLGQQQFLRLFNPVAVDDLGRRRGGPDPVGRDGRRRITTEHHVKGELPVARAIFVVRFSEAEAQAEGAGAFGVLQPVQPAAHIAQQGRARIADAVLAGQQPAEPRDLRVLPGVAPIERLEEVRSDERFAHGGVGQALNGLAQQVPARIVALGDGGHCRRHRGEKSGHAAPGRVIVQPRPPGRPCRVGHPTAVLEQRRDEPLVGEQLQHESRHGDPPGERVAELDLGPGPTVLELEDGGDRAFIAQGQGGHLDQGPFEHDRGLDVAPRGRRKPVAGADPLLVNGQPQTHRA